MNVYLSLDSRNMKYFLSMNLEKFVIIIEGVVAKILFYELNHVFFIFVSFLHNYKLEIITQITWSKAVSRQAVKVCLNEKVLEGGGPLPATNPGEEIVDPAQLTCHSEQESERSAV